MPFWLTIQRHSGTRIDLQIVEQVKHALEVGILRPGDPLPGVRDLARDLTLAPNTIVKAFEELQRLGLIESRPRTGTVVAGDLNGALRREQIAAGLGRVDAAVRDAAGPGISRAAVLSQVEAALARYYAERPGTARESEEQL